MTESDTSTFRSLAGIEPGVTTVSEVSRMFGEPDLETITDGDILWDYKSLGIRVVVDRDHKQSTDRCVEVNISSPFNIPLSCGLEIGQPMELARRIIANFFRVTDKYEDAIYFHPTTDDSLLACAENWNTDKVVSIELMCHSNRNLA